MRDEYDKQNKKLETALTSIKVFKEQIKIFEKKVLSDNLYEQRLTTTNQIKTEVNQVFEREKQKSGMSINDPSKVSAAAAAQMKKTLENNINRIDLLTDGKIHDMKALM